jgi:hypothetical protein
MLYPEVGGEAEVRSGGNGRLENANERREDFVQP